MSKKDKLFKSYKFSVKHLSLAVLAGLAWVGFSTLVTAGTNEMLVYLLGVALIGSLLNNVLSR